MPESPLTPFEVAAVLVVVATAFGYLNHRLIRLPHTIGLTIMGAIASLVLVGLDVLWPDVGLGHAVRGLLENIDFRETLLDGMLSFLLFAGALHVDLGNLLKRKWAVATLATIGVLISTVVVASLFKGLTLIIGFEVPFIWCLLLGALISPTDPVAVMGILKTVDVPPSLEAKVAGESLFNDGVGIVVFSILLAAATGTPAFSPLVAGEMFLVEAVGGAVFGLVIGGIGFVAMKGIDEYNLEILITLAIVMGGYAFAHTLGVSGPVAMATAGLLIGNHGMALAMSERSRKHVTQFWSLIDEVLNSILFLLIGLEVVVIAARSSYLVAGAVTVAIVLFARAVSVGLPMAVLSRFSPFTRGAFPVLVWGGLRGGISIALVLALPAGELREAILTVTYIVVVFSVVVQGSTIGMAARHFVGRPEDMEPDER